MADDPNATRRERVRLIDPTLPPPGGTAAAEVKVLNDAEAALDEASALDDGKPIDTAKDLDDAKVKFAEAKAALDKARADLAALTPVDTAPGAAPRIAMRAPKNCGPFRPRQEEYVPDGDGYVDVLAEDLDSARAHGFTVLG